MSSYHESVKRLLSEVKKFLNVTLQSEILSMPAVKERSKLIELLQKLFADYDSLAPSLSGDEGSTSSAKDTSQDESRNTADSSQCSEEDSYADNIPDTTIKALTLTGAVKMGYLDKRQKDLFITSWQKRYCAIHKNIMYIFKKIGDKKQQGAFFLTDYEVREAPQNVKEAAKKDGSFELVCPGKKTHQFVVESKEELQSWRIAIAAVNEKTTTIEEGTDDLYEPLSEPVSSSSLNAAGPAAASVADTEEIYDEASSMPQGKPALPQIIPVIPFKKGTPPNKVDLNQNMKTEAKVEAFEDDDDGTIYEPIGVDDLPGQAPVTSNKSKKNSLPSLAFPLPALPSHLSRQPDSAAPALPSREEARPSLPGRAPLPLPPTESSTPSRDDAPPPLPGRTVIPPPPTDPLPAIPQIPKKTITPVLGKILNPCEDFENMFYGMWACKGTTDNELCFDQGQIVHIISRDLDKDNWWVGELDGKIGLVPKSYLTPAYEEVH